MNRRTLIALLLVLPGLVFVTAAAPQRPAASATTLLMRLMQAGNKSPFANVEVIVYYWPFNPPAHFAPPVIATARTSARGKFSARLNTSMVPRTGLADVGSGPRAFNTVVFALAPSRQVVIWHQVMQLQRVLRNWLTCCRTIRPLRRATPS